MNAGMQAGLAIAAGYLLGRTRKMKLALTVGGLVAGRRMGGGGEMVKQAMDTLRSSPQADRLKGEVRKQLLDAGKSAALTAAGDAMGSLAGRIRPDEPSDDDGEPDEDARGAHRKQRNGSSSRRSQSESRGESEGRRREGAPRKARAQKTTGPKSAPRKAAPRKSSTRTREARDG